MYEKGKGIPLDYRDALQWYTRAAEQGDVNAQVHIAWMYEVGEGVPQDYQEAAKWWRLAADQEGVGVR